MALQLRQELRLTQQLIMTPQLQMAIKLLQLNRIELVDRIHQELEENPALEEVRQSAADESSGEKVETLPAESPPEKELSIEEKVYKDENIKLARRTVAKYREQLGILSSTKRRQF